MPPVTQRTILWPCTAFARASAMGWRWLLDSVCGALEADLAPGDLLERDRKGLRGAVGVEGDLWRRVLGDALAELAEIGVDLTGALRGQDDERVLGVHVFQQ